MSVTLPQPFYFKGGDSAVILLHTFAGSPMDVQILGRNVQRAGYTVLGPAFSGHATADPTNIFLKGNPTQWWADTQLAVNQLKADGHDQIAIFGESLGGLFAVKAMEELSNIVAGGTISTPLFPIDTSKVAERFLQDARAWYKKIGTSAETIDTKMAFLHDQINLTLQGIRDYTVPIHDKLNVIKQPTFIAQPDADELIDRTVGPRLADTLQNQTTVSYHHYPNAPHVMTYSPQGRELADDLVAFLKMVF